MRLDVRRGVLLVACVSSGFIISAGPGLLARAAEPSRWSSAFADEAAASGSLAGTAQRRIAELESRVKELESERAQRGADKPADLAQNAELMARNRQLSLENQELVGRGFEQSSRLRTCEPPTGEDPKAQLRYWARQLRDDDASVGRLSTDWNNALNLLLRQPRPLDRRNPWREP